MKGQRNWPKIKPNTRAVERKLPYGAKPKQGESVEEEETRPYHASDRPAINEHASKRVPSASTGAREGHDGAPPTAESKRQKPINQSGLH